MVTMWTGNPESPYLGTRGELGGPKLQGGHDKEDSGGWAPGWMECFLLLPLLLYPRNNKLLFCMRSALDPTL